jgi:hypothetical protein
MKKPVAFVLAALFTAVSGPALAADDVALCETQARNVERELSWRKDQMPLEERMRVHQRLSAANALCSRDSERAAIDLQTLQREMVQQSWIPQGTPAPQMD